MPVCAGARTVFTVGARRLRLRRVVATGVGLGVLTVATLLAFATIDRPASAQQTVVPDAGASLGKAAVGAFPPPRRTHRMGKPIAPRKKRGPWIGAFDPPPVSK